MLPETHRQTYQAFRQVLEQIAIATTQPNVNGTTLQQATHEAQSVFQQSVLPLDLNDLTSIAESQVRAVVVEINKQLRMLAMDVMRLQGARQAETITQRLQQIHDRLNTLIRYCDMVLQLQ
jgi:hypothetical protein